MLSLENIAEVLGEHLGLDSLHNLYKTFDRKCFMFYHLIYYYYYFIYFFPI